MIQVEGRVTADNANVLSGTDLATCPGPGILELYIASSQSDTNVTFSAPPMLPARAIQPVLRANGTPLLSEMSPLSVELGGGEQIIINVDVVTAATVGYLARFYSLDELP